MTLRVPAEVAAGVRRLAAELGHKPAQISAGLVEEGLRRRDHPLIELQDTAAGRVAYVKGTRLAVYWLVGGVQRLDGDVEKAAKTWDLPVEKVRAALQYAAAFPNEIAADMAEAEANRVLLEKSEAAFTKAAGQRPGSNVRGRNKRA
jgi:uncharacterized protein (DUF433 family)